MAGLVDLQDLDRSIKSDYSSSEENLLDDFYVPMLDQSVIYRRAAGFFSSGLIALRPLAFANFVERLGVIDLICSPRIQRVDLDAFVSQPSVSVVTRSQVVEELRTLHSQDDKWRSLSIAMTSMIQSGVMNLRVLVPQIASETSIFHDKMGLLSDGTNWVTFVGSANETASAWLPDRNHEILEVFRSWSDRDKGRVMRHRYLFDRLWNGPRGWKMLRQWDFEEDLFEIAPPTDLASALERVASEAGGAQKPNAFSGRIHARHKSTPLRQNQIEVVDNWEAGGHRGIVTFATGGGKSLVAIEAIRRWRRTGGSVLLLVPTSILLRQWLDDLTTELSDVPITAVGGGHQISGREMLIRTALQNSLVVATYRTAGTDRFRQLIREPEKLLVVADEVHNSGQPSFVTFLDEVNAGARLGLSATPKRFGDPDGTSRLRAYFGSDLLPAFTLADAISSKVLVHYFYDYESVTLEMNEQDAYDDLTDRIRKLSYLADLGSGSVPDAIRFLLIRRARIVKNASGKPGVAARIVRDNWEPGDRWLIYCAEQSQLGKTKAMLEQLDRDQVIEYHQNMEGSREETIRFFTDRTGILLAIKCLDEGVNIPSINKAVILASSTNPREYIQRRGRLLRRSDGKEQAHIWDCMVRDRGGRIISEGELLRGIEFARTSESPATLLGLQHEAREGGYDVVDFEGDSDEVSEIGQNG